MDKQGRHGAAVEVWHALCCATPRCEVTTLVLVLLYGFLVLVDLAISGLHLAEWEAAYLLIDLIFLCLFLLEVVLRLFAFGLAYMRSLINLVDAFAIIISFAITLLESTGTLQLLVGETSGVDELRRRPAREAALRMLATSDDGAWSNAEGEVASGEEGAWWKNASDAAALDTWDWSAKYQESELSMQSALVQYAVICLRFVRVVRLASVVMRSVHSAHGASRPLHEGGLRAR